MQEANAINKSLSELTAIFVNLKGNLKPVSTCRYSLHTHYTKI